MKRQIAYSITLAIVWCLFNENFSLNTFLLGLVLSWVIILLLRRTHFGPMYMHRILLFFRFLLIFLKEVIKANLAVIRLIYKFNLQETLRPGILEYRLTVQSDFLITALANAITLTPGTLSVDVSPDRQFLYIHFLHIDDPEEAKTSIRKTLEQPILMLLDTEETEVPAK